MSPIIDEDGQISMIPGERLAVWFEKEKDRLIKPRLVTDAAEEEGCVIFDCKHRDGFLSPKVVDPYPQELTTAAAPSSMAGRTTNASRAVAIYRCRQT